MLSLRILTKIKSPRPVQDTLLKQQTDGKKRVVTASSGCVMTFSGGAVGEKDLPGIMEDWEC